MTEQQPQAPDVEPLDVDGVNAVIVGTVIWAAGLAYCLARRDTLGQQGRSWWIWACAAGLGLGLLGLAFTMRRRAAYRAARAASHTN